MKTITEDDLFNLVTSLYPQGRAFDVKKDPFYSAVIRGVIKSYIRTVGDGNAIQVGLNPNDDDFTAEQATILEKRYGIIINKNRPLVDRKATLVARMTDPGLTLAKQHKNYIEYRLQQAGFNVFVHENRFLQPFPTSSAYSGAAYSGSSYSGNEGYDYYAIDPGSVASTGKVRNYTKVEDDGEISGQVSASGASYSGSAWSTIERDNSDTQWWKSVFFIGGQTFPDSADVEATRIDEFRHLILTLKPVHSRADYIINFI
jgi:hypothetical protein